VTDVRRLAWVLLAVGAAAAIYVVAEQRDYIRDFGVYQTAARRALAGEPLYRADDGFFQFKYWPAFALAMAPFAYLPHELAKFLWFAISAGLIAALLALSIQLLPDRRLSEQALAWWTLLMTAKFIVRELCNGQTNALLGVLAVGALAALRSGRAARAGALVGAAVFAKPYALILVPWLAVTHGLRALAAAGGVVLAGLLVPALIYGWSGNLALLADWYRTVSATTDETLAVRENMSFASLYGKWLGATPAAYLLALASSAAAGLLALRAWWRRDRVARPDYLDVGLLLLLVPLVSPQGWDYVLLIAAPAVVCLIDRYGALSGVWRIAVAAGFLLTSLMLFDLYRRTVYVALTGGGVMTIGGVLLVLAAARLRARALA
jgi:hypothetical protein